ncbi:MAG: hypothetical protein DBY30_08880 [Verrucomicrobia bacterium]|nr:MAG: hypothetical protein DBY30_08880 [Verrucomicrobiota bacterium]
MIKSAPLCLCKKKIRIFAAAEPAISARKGGANAPLPGAKKAEPDISEGFRLNEMPRAHRPSLRA